MRISDWSSDVCSSDLHLSPTRYRLAPVAQILRASRDQECLVGGSASIGSHIRHAMPRVSRQVIECRNRSRRSGECWMLCDLRYTLPVDENGDRKSVV